MTTKEMTETTEEVVEPTKTHQTIEKAMQTVDEVMFNVVSSDVEVLRDASHHILEAGGKRVRPRLVTLSYLALGGEDLEGIAPAAAALELVHTASVVHDDINDHGVVRRGRPSVNAIWGRTFALLTGDYLFTKVYELMAPYGREMNELFAQATIALVEGETLQAAAVKNKNFSREVYMDIIARKTAVLFKIGAMMGGQLAEATDEQFEALSQFGFNIGLAFQIVDDVLDIIGDEEQLGKTAGIDIEQGKGFTAVEGDVMESIKRKLMSADRLDKAREQARTLMEQAVNTLTDTIPPSTYRDELVALAHLVVERDR
jgi:geranylgeranyl pyrophosphate synthase